MNKSIRIIDELLIGAGAKPTWKDLNAIDAVKDDIEIETKIDGMRAVCFKDIDTGYYKLFSSSGKPYRADFKNIFKQLKPALDDGYIFSGELLDITDPDDRGKANSIATNSKTPPDKILFVVWNMIKPPPEAIAKGTLSPDSPEVNPPYKEMRLEMLKMLRKLKPTQVKATKRWKMSGNTLPSDIFKKIVSKGQEGIVAKYKTGGVGYLKHKMETVLAIYPLLSFNTSDSSTRSGLITSLTVKFTSGSPFNVGGGMSFDKQQALTKLFQDRQGNPAGLFVGVKGGRPAKPGGVPHVPQFVFLSTDADGKQKILESVESVSSTFLELYKEVTSGYIT